MNEIVWIGGIGFISGVVLTYLVMRLFMERKKGIPLRQVEEKYIQKALYEQLRQDIMQKDTMLQSQYTTIATYQSDYKNLQERFETYRKELEDMQANFKNEFRNLANDLLDEKSTKFVALNEEKIGSILNPLKEKIAHFEKKIEDTHQVEVRERISLKKELETIVKLNQQVSEDATRLSNALLGDKKLQGNWGEIQLEMILEKAGLEKDIHYQREQSFKTEGGIYRPDYIIHLPDKKSIVIDSKVSLVAYEQYHNEQENIHRTIHLKRHLENIKDHIKSLGGKNYHQIYDIHSPDYILLFVPIEPALSAALREDLSLFDKALDKNIVLVSVSTLLATLRTIAFIWKQENQRKNVLEIARESGALYDKFVGFIEDMERIGRNIKLSEKEYDAAMNKLTTSTKRGDTIVGRIERIKALGADASKSLPDSILDK